MNRFLKSLSVLSVLLSPANIIARDLPSGGEAVWKVKSALEGTGLAVDSVGETQGWQGLGFGRLRLETEFQPAPGIGADLGYDCRIFSSRFTLSSALPSDQPAPYRIWQIGGRLGHGEGLEAYHELDRAFAGLRAGAFSLVVGRQAVGWGRGALFSAVDLFSPFTPLEVDREWRRGVDAVNGDWKMTGTSSLNLVAAFGASLDDSVLGLRLRGYLGEVDGEFLFARRAADLMAGLTSSWVMGPAEVHAEAALFKTPGDAPGGLPAHGDLVPKAVLGVSNNFNLGGGLSVVLEYHYSGFGVESAPDLPVWLAKPDYLKRYLRGDTQITGRQAVALVAGTSFSQEWSGSLQVIQSLVDSSNLAAPSLLWNFSESMSLSAAGYMGFGPGIKDAVPQSQFGDVPATLLAQVKFYD
jgi:hypothetical protein